MITARHWVRTSLLDAAWPLELHDGAQVVQIDNANWADRELIPSHPFPVPVCCGPAAHLPGLSRSGGMDRQ